MYERVKELIERLNTEHSLARNEYRYLITEEQQILECADEGYSPGFRTFVL